MKPKKTIKGLTFFPIPEFTDLDLAFGVREKDYFDRYDLPDIPSEYETIAQDLMFKGGRLEGLSKQVDIDKATRAVQAWLRSFAPAHEAKMATVAYALWLWSDDEALKG